MSRKYYLTIIFIGTFSVFSLAQDTITYQLSFPNAIRHEAEINVEVSGRQDSNSMFVMSSTSPGRYAMHNFAKNIYNLSAYNKDSVDLDMERIEPDAWNVAGESEDFSVRYTLYANHPSGTFSGIDIDFVVLNMPASLIWFPNMENIPVKVVFNLPDTSTWKIATQLQLLDSVTHTYFAPDLEYLMDSPCLLGNLKAAEFEAGTNSSKKIKLAIDAGADQNEVDKLNSLIESIVNEQIAIFGGLPDFKDDQYTFLCSYGPGRVDDAMEHRNSTMITSNLPLPDNQEKLMGSISHEFFHVWNIERIRPSSLEPFDFRQPNMSGELWFAEGFTSYYGDLVQCRAGIIPQDRYLNNLSKLINYAYNAPGIQSGSPVEMSQMATYTDQSSFVDDTNFDNVFFSYYRYGEILGLALDLSIRSKFPGKSLDDLMKFMWEQYGKPEKTYTNQDIESALGQVMGDTNFAKEFFSKHIYDNELPNFEELFDAIGYKLSLKNPGKPGFGFIKLAFKGDTAVVLSKPLKGTGFYEAGLSKMDMILSIDDQPVTSYPELNFINNTRKAGDVLDVRFVHHGKARTGKFTVREDSQVILIPKERFSMRVEDQEEVLRSNWLGSRIQNE